jgi:hypothetical protein
MQSSGQEEELDSRIRRQSSYAVAALPHPGAGRKPFDGLRILHTPA